MTVLLGIVGEHPNIIDMGAEFRCILNGRDTVRGFCVRV